MIAGGVRMCFVIFLFGFFYIYQHQAKIMQSTARFIKEENQQLLNLQFFVIFYILLGFLLFLF